MNYRIFCIAVIVLVALSAGMAFCHLMEAPARLDYPARLWMQVTVVEGTYDTFGPPIGAAIEGLAWICAVMLAIMMRSSRRFPFALAGAGLMMAAHAAWWIFVNPMNQQMAAWNTATLPANFDSVRQQWEYAHGARALLQIAALLFITGACVSSGDRAT